ncbi:MAG: 2OG-Fe(II) oxygenase [Terricaulis sp.]
MTTGAALRDLAASGDPRAQLRLAHLILIGRERSFAPNQAMQLLNAACAQRHGDALLYHATLALRGIGRPKSHDEALALLKDAAAAGDTRAKGQLQALGGKIDRDVWWGPVHTEQHHDSPRVFTIRNFIPAPACNWLIKYGRKNLQRAAIQDAAKNGAFVVDDARTNSVAPTSILQHDLVIQLTNMRIAAMTGIPIAQQEATNILHYARGQQYAPHFDFIREHEEAGFAHELRSMGQRVLTFLIYLNDDYEGGETAFPLLNWSFKGKAGDALMFWNLSAAGEREQLSLHAGTPVTKGEKWLLSKWMRQRPVPPT